MELVVWALAALAFAAILARFVFRDASGQVRLPRIVDESMGMWLIRRALGRETDPDMDPFARFRRPSTVLARRPGEPAHRAAGRTARAASPSVPSVLQDPAEAAPREELAPAWSTIERAATRGRPFGESILATPAEPARWRARRLLQYAVLVVVVAAGGLAVGALAGVASGPSTPSTSGSPAGSATVGVSPAGSSPAASPR